MTEFKRSCRSCGWSGTYDTPKRGDYAKRKHSCDKHREKAARAERHAARMAAVDRTPKPCRHKEADHVHGTYAAYVLDFCRCQPCVEARAAYDRDRHRQQAYGRWDHYVDATPAREHVQSLMAQGMGLKRIVAVSDISQGVLWKLVYGKRQANGSQTPTRRVRKDTLERILAIPLDLADGAKVDATGTTRRVQALMALGWSSAKIGRRLGILTSNMAPLVHGQRQVVKTTADAVRDLYDELSMTLPPQETHRDKIAASRARNMAKANGWLPPLAWDDERIDDPTYRPSAGVDTYHRDEIDEAAIYRRMHGDRSVRLSKADAVELVRRWARSGRSLNECERITGLPAARYYKAGDQDGAA